MGNGTDATASAEADKNAFTVDVEDYYHGAALELRFTGQLDQHEPGSRQHGSGARAAR